MLRTFSRMLPVLLAFVVAVAAAPLAQKKDEKKPADGGLSAAQRQELLPLFRLVDQVMKGTAPGTYLVPPPPKDGKDKGKEGEAAAAAPQPAPAEVPITWRNDFLKAQNQQIFVPFTVQVEPGKIGSSVAGYLRVAPKGSQGLTPPAQGEKPQTYPFEDVYFTELRATPGQPLKLTRAFAVPAGSYDVYVALRERSGAADAPIKVAVHKQDLVVPDYHGAELQTSSIIVAEKIEQLSSPLAPEAQKERPYVLGDNEIVPVPDMKFKKTEELQVIFQIYGATLGEDKKPDVSVEYIFHQKDGTGEKPFNKTAPQAFTAQTLPPNFDPAQGHQLVAGQAVPLASFPEGDFRLEIKITDNKAQKNLSKDVLFSVVPAS
jgi:hypothetical protein